MKCFAFHKSAFSDRKTLSENFQPALVRTFRSTTQPSAVVGCHPLCEPALAGDGIDNLRVGFTHIRLTEEEW